MRTARTRRKPECAGRGRDVGGFRTVDAQDRIDADEVVARPRARNIVIASSSPSSTRLGFESRNLPPLCRAAVHHLDTEEEVARLAATVAALWSFGTRRETGRSHSPGYASKLDEEPNRPARLDPVPDFRNDDRARRRIDPKRSMNRDTDMVCEPALDNVNSSPCSAFRRVLRLQPAGNRSRVELRRHEHW